MNYFEIGSVSNLFLKESGSQNDLPLQAAFVGKPGSDLASNLGITPQDDVLYAVFSESDSSEGEITSKPNKNSALCVYSLKKIRRKFMQNIQRCFTGMYRMYMVLCVLICAHTGDCL